jgi:hypothetical protein
VAAGDEGQWGEARGTVRGNGSSLGRAPHGGAAQQEVDGGGSRAWRSTAVLERT